MPKLFHQIQATCRENQPGERFTDVEKTRNCFTYRIVSVFNGICELDNEWSTVQSFVQVERIGIRIWKALSTDQLLHQFFSGLCCSMQRKLFVDTGELKTAYIGLKM